MKAYKLLFFLAILTFNSFGKSSTDTLEISFNKTIHLFFESHVQYFDVGSPDVLIDSATNMIKLKAAVEEFEPTNLTILTTGGIHHFILVFNDSPKTYVHQIRSSQAPNSNNTQTTSAPVVFKEKNEKKAAEEKRNDAFEEAAEKAIKKAGFTDMGAVDKRTRFLLKDIFIQGEHLYFVVEVKNESNIKYDIDFIRFVTKNKKSFYTKRYAIQETVLKPEFIFNEKTNTITPKSSIHKVFIFEKFTIAEDKKLFLELWEKGGERQINFSVEDSDILKAKNL